MGPRGGGWMGHMMGRYPLAPGWDATEARSNPLCQAHGEGGPLRLGFLAEP